MSLSTDISDLISKHYPEYFKSLQEIRKTGIEPNTSSVASLLFDIQNKPVTHAKLIEHYEMIEKITQEYLNAVYNPSEKD